MLRPLPRLFLATLIPVMTLFATGPADAAKIKSVKGKKATVDLEKDKLTDGQILEIVGKDGKVKGLIKIQKQKGTSAAAIIGKGSGAPGDSLRPRAPKALRTTKKEKPRPQNQNATTISNVKAASSIGVLVGFAQSSASVTLASNSNTVDLSGSGFSVKGLYDYTLLEWLDFRFLGGLEQFNVGGASNSGCTGAGECNAEISYLSLDFWGRIPFDMGHLRPWAGAGFSLMFPLSKSSTALDQSSITNTSVLALGGGVDWLLGDGRYIPLQIEYGRYPTSDQVKASWINVRVGYAWAY